MEPTPAVRGSRVPVTLPLIIIAGAVALGGLGRAWLLLAVGAGVLLLPVSIGAIRGHRFLTMMWLMAGLWCLAQVISNVFHGMPLVTQFVVAGPVAMLLCTTLVWVRQQTGAHPAGVVIAFCLGWGVNELLAAPPGLSENPWKFGLALPIIVGVLAWADRRGLSVAAQSAFLFFLAAVSLYFDSRLYVAACFLTAVVILVAGSGRLRRPRSSAKVAAAGLLAFGLVYLSYPTFAASGLLGDRASRQQQLIQANGVNLIAAARPEFLQSAYLTAQHPLLGLGGAATLTAQEATAAVDFTTRVTGPTANQNNYLLGEGRGFRGFVLHSSALDASVAAGVAALGFWILLIRHSIASVARGGRNGGPTAAVVFVSLLAVWNAFFSPLGSRGYLGLGLTLFLLAVARREDRSPEPAGYLYGSR